MKKFLILGLGRFSRSLAVSLCERGHEVMVVDKNEELISEIKNQVTYAVIGDCTDEAVLKSFGVRNFDIVVVSVGESLEASIMTTALLKELGAVEVIVKGQNELHARVLQKVGADKVILPERDMGARLAQVLTVRNFLDFIDLTPQYKIMEISVLPQWVGRSLTEVDIRKKHRINVLAIKAADGTVNAEPRGETVLEKTDILVVLGDSDSLNTL